jgi:proteasome lid subunit RPN8/RPN11
MMNTTRRMILTLALLLPFSPVAVAADAPPAAIADLLAACQGSAGYAKLECAAAVVTDGSGFKVTPLAFGDEYNFKMTIQVPKGERIVALFHTHTGRDPRADVFSDNDVATSERLGVPSYIYVLRTGMLREYKPNGRHYVAQNNGDAGKLVGRFEPSNRPLSLF